MLSSLIIKYQVFSRAKYSSEPSNLLPSFSASLIFGSIFHPPSAYDLLPCWVSRGGSSCIVIITQVFWHRCSISFKRFLALSQVHCDLKLHLALFRKEEGPASSLLNLVGLRAALRPSGLHQVARLPGEVRVCLVSPFFAAFHSLPQVLKI